MVESRSTLILLSLGLLIFSSCKTQEQIAREQMVDNMSIQMTEGRKLNTDTLIRIQDLETRVAKLSGTLEEESYNRLEGQKNEKKNVEERIHFLEETNAKKTDEIKAHKKDLRSIKRKLAGQKKYLDKLLKSINLILNKKTKPKRKKVATKKKKSSYDQAMADYRKGRYKKAKPVLLNLLEDSSIKGKQKARVLHNLGMISYIDKKDENALSYFGKLYTEYPKTPYIPNGLLFLAKSFIRLNQTQQAEQTLQEIVTNHPKSQSAKKAKVLLKKL